MANEVSFNIRIDDNGTAQKVTVDVEELAEAIKKVEEAGEQLKKNTLNFATMAQSVDSFVGTLQTLQQNIEDLSAVYSKQIEAETKLAQVMQNTMGATADDVQAIKDLCAAQQQLGVIGDEVQLAGAQELSTYLEKRSSLERLIPVMNDMIAQQYGFEASQESAASIATMLGKVMEGQTSALSRYGYSFTEAQEKILKFGTEEQRAAVLAEVVSASVGGVNEALAQTDYGKIVQANNAWGDMQEKLGEIAVKVRPVISGLTATGQVTGAILKLGEGIKVLSSIIKSFCMSNPLLAVLTGLAAAATALYFALTDDGGAAERLAEQTEAYNNAAAAATSEMNDEIAKLEILIDSQGNEADTVDNLNAKYGKIFGTYQTAAEWYDILSAKSRDYAKQKALEAKSATISSQLGNKQIEIDELEKQAKELVQKYGKSITEGWSIFDTNVDSIKKGQYREIIDQLKKARDAANDLDKQYKETLKSSNELAASLKPTTFTTTEVTGTDTGGDKTTETAAAKQVGKVGSLAYINDRIKDLKGKIEFETDPFTRQKLQSELNKWEFDKKIIEIELSGDYNKKLSTNTDASGAIGDGTDVLAGIDKLAPVGNLTDYGNTLDEVGTKQRNFQSTVGSLSNSFATLGESIGGSAGEMAGWAAQTLAAIAQVIPQIMALNVANQARAMGEATASGAAVPFPANLIAIAAGIAAVVAAFASMPKFAAGGIAYGPTMGLFGEYPGAANNPEVVAPLSRLKSLLNTDETGGNRVEFKIRGRQLVGVLNKESNLRRKS